MKGQAVVYTSEKVREPEPLGERCAAYVQDYLALHKGLSPGELAFRLKVDKRDLARLMRDRSIGPRMLDRLGAYFGDLFIDVVIRDPLLPDGRSIREVELERERAELGARRERLERDRAARRLDRAEDRVGLRVVPDEGRQTSV